MSLKSYLLLGISTEGPKKLLKLFYGPRGRSGIFLDQIGRGVFELDRLEVNFYPIFTDFCPPEGFWGENGIFALFLAIFATWSGPRLKIATPIVPKKIPDLGLCPGKSFRNFFWPHDAIPGRR